MQIMDLSHLLTVILVLLLNGRNLSISKTKLFMNGGSGLFFFATTFKINVEGARHYWSEYGQDGDYGFDGASNNEAAMHLYNRCPSMCECEGKETRPHVDCSTRNLTQVPLGISQHTAKM